MGRKKKSAKSIVEDIDELEDIESVDEGDIDESEEQNEETPTAHIAAKKGDISPFVLMPGDPARAKYIAKNFLKDVKMITDKRGILGYEGSYNDEGVFVMASGMGGASIGLYSYELYAFYDVETIIRVGSAAGLQEDMNAGSLSFAMTASTDSSYACQYGLPGTFCPSADFSLLRRATKYAKKNDIEYTVGSLFSSDTYSAYNARGEDSWKAWANMGCISQDMETYALYCNAARFKKSALSIVTNVVINPTGDAVDISDLSIFDSAIETALSLR